MESLNGIVQMRYYMKNYSVTDQTPVSQNVLVVSFFAIKIKLNYFFYNKTNRLCFAHASPVFDRNYSCWHVCFPSCVFYYMLTLLSDQASLAFFDSSSDFIVMSPAPRDCLVWSSSCLHIPSMPSYYRNFKKRMFILRRKTSAGNNLHLNGWGSTSN